MVLAAAAAPSEESSSCFMPPPSERKHETLQLTDGHMFDKGADEDDEEMLMMNH